MSPAGEHLATFERFTAHARVSLWEITLRQSTIDTMLWLILALVICVGLASAVVGLVAVPARREGRELLTDRGERVVSTVASGTEKVAKGAKEATAVVTKKRRDDDADTSAATTAKPAASTGARVTTPAAAPTTTQEPRDSRPAQQHRAAG